MLLSSGIIFQQKNNHVADLDLTLVVDDHKSQFLSANMNENIKIKTDGCRHISYNNQQSYRRGLFPGTDFSYL